MVTFSYWKKDDYLTVAVDNKIRVYKNLELALLIELQLIKKNITGAWLYVNIVNTFF